MNKKLGALLKRHVAARLAAKPTLDVSDFTWLTETRLGGYGQYVIERDRVGIRPLTPDDANLFSDQQAAILRESARALRFPCTRVELLRFVKGSNRDFSLPAAFSRPWSVQQKRGTER